MSVLRIKDPTTGEFISVPSIKGDKGDPGEGLDLSDLSMTAVQSQTAGFSRLTLSDGATSKSVEIPVATLDPADVSTLTNIANAYLNNLVNGDGVSY